MTELSSGMDIGHTGPNGFDYSLTPYILVVSWKVIPCCYL